LLLPLLPATSNVLLVSSQITVAVLNVMLQTLQSWHLPSTASNGTRWLKKTVADRSRCKLVNLLRSEDAQLARKLLKTCFWLCMYWLVDVRAIAAVASLYSLTCV
jgi:hypothetical protein